MCPRYIEMSSELENVLEIFVFFFIPRTYRLALAIIQAEQTE